MRALRSADTEDEQVTTEPKSALRHFTTEAFGPRERIAACHEVYGRTIAKIDLEPPADDEFMIDGEAAQSSGPRPGLDDEHRIPLSQAGEPDRQ